MNTEILRDLLDCDAWLTTTGETNDVIPELSGIKLRHNNILPARPPRTSQLRCHQPVQQTPRSIRTTTQRDFDPRAAPFRHSQS
jgi:hypothetical protein